MCLKAFGFYHRIFSSMLDLAMSLRNRHFFFPGFVYFSALMASPHEPAKKQTVDKISDEKNVLMAE